MDLQQVLLSRKNPNNETAIPVPIQKTPYHHKIESLDLEPIKFKLVKEQGWTLEKADSVEKLYKAYLLLFALYPSEQHVPTHDIDEMWHSHILDTQKYMADCQHIFGYYLHHYPYLGLMGTEDAVLAAAEFDRTRRRFVEVAGLDPALAADCGGGGCGGGSCSSSSCSSSSCSSGGDTGGGHDHGGGTDPGIIPIISSCTSSVPSKPLKDEWNRKREKPQTPANNNPAKKEKRPFWKKIIGLVDRSENPAMPAQTPGRWERSVDPGRMLKKARPGRAALLALLEAIDTEKATRH